MSKGMGKASYQTLEIGGVGARVGTNTMQGIREASEADFKGKEVRITEAN
jgi:hypothetical protein